MSAGRPKDEWNLAGLAHDLSSYALSKEAQLDAPSVDGIVAAANDRLKVALTAQRERLGRPFSLLARYIILTTIDEAWRTHLYNLDDLKGGIGWTAYGGTDPLVAFKRESFVMFQEMLATAAEKIVRIVLNPRLTVSAGPAPRRAPENVRYVHSSAAPPPSRQQSKARGSQRSVRIEKEPGRNDPCPCGSGKKYKKCCGRVS